MHDHSDIPHGYCACGCGEKTEISKYTKSDRGWIKGQPRKYVKGHNGRKHYGEPPNPSGLCMCGCGGVTPLARVGDPALGHIIGEHLKYIHGHNRKSSPVEYVEEDRGHGTPCWIWQGRLERGYGSKRVGKRFTGAHRYMYEKLGREIPDGMHLDHLCRQPACVNPDHLEPVTPQENNRRASGTRLNPEQVVEIRRSDETLRVLGERYGVNRSTISAVKRGKSWRDIPW